MRIKNNNFKNLIDKKSIKKIEFDLGNVLITQNAKSSLFEQDIKDALNRHHNNDWGDCSDSDWMANFKALRNDERILSVYYSNEIKFWIITEWDRSVTTILLPEDY